jgi:hypothetical protein
LFLHVLQIYCEFFVLVICYIYWENYKSCLLDLLDNIRQFLYIVLNTCAKYFVVHCKNIKSSFFSYKLQSCISNFCDEKKKKTKKQNKNNVYITFTYIIKTLSTVYWFSCSLFFSNEKGNMEKERLGEKEIGICHSVFMFNCNKHICIV